MWLDLHSRKASSDISVENRLVGRELSKIQPFRTSLVVKNPPAKAGANSWSGKMPRAVKQLSPRAATTEARVF